MFLCPDKAQVVKKSEYSKPHKERVK